MLLEIHHETHKMCQERSGISQRLHITPFSGPMGWLLCESVESRAYEFTTYKAKARWNPWIDMRGTDTALSARLDDPIKMRSLPGKNCQ
jgi:hypothetical protein